MLFTSILARMVAWGDRLNPLPPQNIPKCSSVGVYSLPLLNNTSIVQWITERISRIANVHLRYPTEHTEWPHRHKIGRFGPVLVRWRRCSDLIMKQDKISIDKSKRVTPGTSYSEVQTRPQKQDTERDQKMSLRDLNNLQAQRIFSGSWTRTPNSRTFRTLDPLHLGCLSERIEQMGTRKQMHSLRTSSAFSN